MIPTAIGDLDQRLTLESPSRTPDGGGGAIVTWSEVGQLWAAVAATTGDERLRAEQVAGRVTHTVVIRHRGDVVPAMRFRAGTRVLDIVAVLEAEQRRRLHCLCEERFL
jgi:SPP1 family predicted phage head-tail adaptor